jgi:hypothetical protein
MAKKEQEAAEQLPAKTTGGGLSVQQSRPDYLAGQKIEGMELISQYVKHPRIKVIHAMAKEPYNKFVEGTVILTPTLQVIAEILLGDNGKPKEQGQPFYVTPVFMFPEWNCWNPLETKGTLPSIVERSQDPHSALAARCSNRDLWFEPCVDADGQPVMNPKKKTEQLMRRNVEHLNYVVSLYAPGTDFDGLVAQISYAKIHHKVGVDFGNKINMRRANPFACVFEGRATFAKNEQGSWYSPVFDNPAEDSGVSPWATKDKFEELRELHRMLKEAHKNKLLQASVDDDDAIDVMATRQPGANSEY